ncbi:hypothetical protein AVEN_82662-1 [Araneus ventricosus]|uniref:Uncharacterized protein n=1 Tax=Araneus ventricosus TaxID=182803 RepID=A0A4Y2VZV7_ARAVE|nr:hypothetical protein AVEN_82662-1 [Araneus ventricosus]
MRFLAYGKDQRRPEVTLRTGQGNTMASGGLAKWPACPMASGPLKQKTIWAPMKCGKEKPFSTTTATTTSKLVGDLDPRTRPAVPGSSCEYCIEKVRLESEMVKSRTKLEGLLKLIKTMEQDYYRPADDSEEYKAIETELEKLRGKRNLIPICVELSCEIRKIDSDVEDKMHDIEYNSPNRRKIAKARNLFNSPAKLIEISNKYEVLNSEEINETIEVNDNPDNSKQAAEELGKVEKSKIPPIMLKYVKNYVDILDVIRTMCGPTENKFAMVT